MNVGSHLLIDCLTQAIDAAVVISNDSDRNNGLWHVASRRAFG